MDKTTCQAILERARTKQAQEVIDPAAAAQQAAGSALRHEAWGDVGKLSLALLAGGAGARGAVGLYHLLKRNLAPRKSRAGPALMPLPYPVEPMGDKTAADPIPAPPAPTLTPQTQPGFFDGVTSKWAVPGYMPAMLFGGMASLGAGWKGIDYLLKRRAETERGAQLDASRKDFHEAMLSQYDKPLGHRPIKRKTAADLGEALDRLYDSFTRLQMRTKEASWPDVAGIGGNAYATYAGLSSLLTGAFVFDQIRKRRRQAILEKALQKRERTRFARQPTEIYAVPEPVERLPKMTQPQESKLLHSQPEESPLALEG